MTEAGNNIGYARISTIDQSPALQIDALKAYGCKRIYQDAVSAVGKERPGFEKALRAVKPGDALVVWKLDRAFRSTLDAILTWEELRERGIQLIVATLGIVSDTPEGRHFYRGLASAAEFERDLISVRTKEGMAAAKRRGKHVGRPPKVTPEMAMQAHRMLNDGFEINDIADELRVTAITLRRALSGHRFSATEVDTTTSSS
ncbi:MAG: recombinase family protein [Pseudomonadota bacterium]